MKGSQWGQILNLSPEETSNPSLGKISNLWPDQIPNLPHIRGVYQETITRSQILNLSPPETDAFPFCQIASKFASLPGTVVLMSGTDLDCARYNILAVDPWLTFKAKGRDCLVEYNRMTTRIKCDPFDCLQVLMDHFTLSGSDDESVYSSREDGSKAPVVAGLFGYLAYDLKQHIENLAVTCMDTGLPDLCLYAPSALVVDDRVGKTTTLFIPQLVFDKGEIDTKIVQQVRDRFFSTLALSGNDLISDPISGPIADLEKGFQVDVQGFSSNFSKSAYMNTVLKIIEYIKAGDIYQVNLSQRFEAGFDGNAFALFQRLFSKNPAPFFAFVNAENHQIVSTSPERFIKRDGSTIETRPIKGTFPRGKTPEEDICLKTGLEESFKDDAELSMIVDLMRNDLGKVARGGTVRIKEHKRLEPYDNVFHLVSIVTAELERGKSSVDLLRATFPGGSITGCPKKRSMEIIDELETMNRHIYTGSLGYLSFHDTMDLSIAIRTATIADNRISFCVGGGIVYDSDPENEFQETLHKGETLMETLEKGMKKKSRQRPYAWVCGGLIPENEAIISAASPGFQYGAGIFETLRVEDGQVLFFDEHLERFHASWKMLFKCSMPEITWPTVADQLIQANGFDKGVFALKIIGADRGAVNPFLAAFIRPYVHRLKLLGKKGLDLVTFPYPRTNPLADHKSLNYHYYLLAAQFAKENGADEALILNPDGSVSETNTCNLIIIKGKTVILPLSDHVLPGITQKVLVDQMEKNGYTILRKRVTPAELFDSEEVLLTNSLMGTVPLLSLDGNQHGGLTG